MVLLCTARIAEKLDSPVPAKREQTKLENCLPSGDCPVARWSQLAFFFCRRNIGTWQRQMNFSKVKVDYGGHHSCPL